MPENALIRTVRKPGEAGTLKLVQQYGDRLVCVRYRYAPRIGKRYKTIELIIAEEDWQPPPRPAAASETRTKHPTTPIVPVRIHYSERNLQRQIKAIGGTWDANRKLWYAPEADIKKIGLANRIVR